MQQQHVVTTSEIAHVPSTLRAVAHRLLALAEDVQQVSVPIAGQLSNEEHRELGDLVERLQRVLNPQASGDEQ